MCVSSHWKTSCVSLLIEFERNVLFYLVCLQQGQFSGMAHVNKTNEERQNSSRSFFTFHSQHKQTDWANLHQKKKQKKNSRCALFALVFCCHRWCPMSKSIYFPSSHRWTNGNISSLSTWCRFLVRLQNSFISICWHLKANSMTSVVRLCRGRILRREKKYLACTVLFFSFVVVLLPHERFFVMANEIHSVLSMRMKRMTSSTSSFINEHRSQTMRHFCTYSKETTMNWRNSSVARLSKTHPSLNTALFSIPSQSLMFCAVPKIASKTLISLFIYVHVRDILQSQTNNSTDQILNRRRSTHFIHAGKLADQLRKVRRSKDVNLSYSLRCEYFIDLDFRMEFSFRLNEDLLRSFHSFSRTFIFFAPRRSMTHRFLSSSIHGGSTWKRSFLECISPIWTICLISTRLPSLALFLFVIRSNVSPQHTKNESPFSTRIVSNPNLIMTTFVERFAIDSCSSIQHDCHGRHRSNVKMWFLPSNTLSNTFSQTRTHQRASLEWTRIGCRIRLFVRCVTSNTTSLVNTRRFTKTLPHCLNVSMCPIGMCRNDVERRVMAHINIDNCFRHCLIV